MGIIIDNQSNSVHLFTGNTSYVIEIFEGELIHSYWGKRITLPRFMGINEQTSETITLSPIEEFCSFYPNPNVDNKTYSLDTIAREYPDFGRSDYRNPSYRLKLSDGTRITKFHVDSMNIIKGKPLIVGLPSTYVEADDCCSTLHILLKDEKSQVWLNLYYVVNETYDVITRFSVFENRSTVTVNLETALSGNVDFYHDNAFDLIHFDGSWARERHMSRLPVGNSTHVIDSKRGSSSHQQNPLILLARENTTDLTGEVYSMNLVYSGSFKAVIEVNSYGTTRMQMGINDFDFDWSLNPSESFYTPELVMTYSDEGFNGMSHIYHTFYRERLCKGSFRDKVRPVLINNWEATYFSFTTEKLQKIGKAASEIGIELFVLDDGWFGERNSDKSGLGDWFVNTKKLPEGLSGIADDMEKQGVGFGLWFEPEMISPNSELYRLHPKWCLHVEGHSSSEARNQLVLDLSRTDVCDYIIQVVGAIIRDHAITYVKWDMNRNMTEVGSQLLDAREQGETGHRYMLGLYHVLDVLTSEFTNVLFESCSGGGGRFDPGMLYYMPQTWTSDDTDAYERLFIQYGTSFAYPPITMAAHVSVSPNHQVGRLTPLKTRGIVSMMANLGYELDLSILSPSDKEQVVQQISLYKDIRRDIQFGRLYRLLSPYDKKGTCSLMESDDQKRYYLFFIQGLTKPNQASLTLPLNYMSEGVYTAKEVMFGDQALESGKNPEIEYPSDFLNHFGYTFKPQNHDFEARLIIFTKKH